MKTIICVLFLLCCASALAKPLTTSFPPTFIAAYECDQVNHARDHFTCTIVHSEPGKAGYFDVVQDDDFHQLPDDILQPAYYRYSLLVVHIVQSGQKLYLGTKSNPRNQWCTLGKQSFVSLSCWPIKSK